MTATAPKSPCPDCPEWGKDMQSCSLSCQAIRDYLHRAFGEPYYSVAERDRQDKAELRRLIDAQAEKATPPKNFRLFTCAECGAEVETTHPRQVTCASPECKRRHKLKRDREKWHLRQGEKNI